MLIPVSVTYLASRISKIFALIMFPSIWVGFEYFHNLWEFNFPWLELGNTESYNIHRIQYIEYTGVHGITFIICTITVLIYSMTGAVYSTGRIYLKEKIIYAVIIVLILFPNIFSYYRLSADNSAYLNFGDKTKNINVSIVQSNTDPFTKWGSDQMSLIESYISKLNECLVSNPDLLLLHETATPFYFLEDYNAVKSQKFIDFVNNNNKYLLMGIPHLEYYSDSASAPDDAKQMKYSGRYYDTYNAAILLEPHKNEKLSTIHKKVKLVPFSEKVPYSKYLPFLSKLLKWEVGLSGWQFGDSVTLFSMKANNQQIRFSVLICFESVFSELVSEAVYNGAEFLVIITNDGWFGKTSGPVQHMQYAVLRAIENRKWIARCAQTGISCFIDPLGNVYNELPYNTEGVISKQIIANNEITFYSRYGDITGKVSYYSAILCFIIGVVFYVKKRKLIK
jgi:apolipoprotein N-acyltransferase